MHICAHTRTQYWWSTSMSTIIVYSMALRGRGEISVTLTKRVCEALFHHSFSAVSLLEHLLKHAAHTRCTVGKEEALGEDVWGHWEFGLWGVFVAGARVQHHGVKSALRRGRGRRTSKIHLERVLTSQAVRMGPHRGVHHRVLRFPHRELAGWVWLRAIGDASGVSATFIRDREPSGKSQFGCGLIFSVCVFVLPLIKIWRPQMCHSHFSLFHWARSAALKDCCAQLDNKIQ